MRILFILPDVDSFHKLNIHFGIAYIARVLKDNGYKDMRFISVSSEKEYDDVVAVAGAYKPDIVAFTSVETQFDTVIRLSQRIKKALGCIVVCGGAFTTLFPESIKDIRSLDGIFRGESEKAFLKFVRAVEQGDDYRRTENFCFYDGSNNRVIYNDLLPLETDLDSIGFPELDIFDFQGVIDDYAGVAPFLFNRGCPYNCSFCSNHALAAVYGKKANLTRKRSVDSCIAEIKNADKRYKFWAVHIWDDLFTADRKWLYEFLDKYRSGVGKPFMCTVRSNICDDELFDKLKQAGCYRVHMSLESGNDFIRNTVMNRNISKEMVVTSFGLAKKYGIEVSASVIIGLPFETEEMIKDTIRLLGKIKAESVGVNIFYPYKSTHLWEVCDKYGMIRRDLRGNIKERRESILDLPHLNPEKLRYYYDNFEDMVRREEGIFSYGKLKMKRMAKKVLPYQAKVFIRRRLNIRQGGK